LISRRDLILRDLECVVLIPHDIAEEVISKSEKKMKSEDKVRIAFRRGDPIAETFDSYKVA
jgi:regulator of RNase E activity RraA